MKKKHIALSITFLVVLLTSCQTQGIYPQNKSSNKQLIHSINQELGQGKMVDNLSLFAKDILEGELGGFCVSYMQDNQKTKQLYQLEQGSFSSTEVEVFKMLNPFVTLEQIQGRSIDNFPLDSIPYHVSKAKELLDKKYAQVSLYRYDFIVDSERGIKQEFILNAVTTNKAKVSDLSIGAYSYYSFYFIVDQNAQVKLVSP